MNETHTVLLADDDPGLLHLLSRSLADDGLDLLRAQDGEEALRVAQERCPQVAVLDIQMPFRDGIEVCRALKEAPQTAGIKVVMLTASGDEEHRARAAAAGADEFMAKPFSPLRLLATVHRLLL